MFTRLLPILVLFLSCKGEPKHNEPMSINIKTETIPEPHIMYGLDVNVYINYEIYLDDIPAEKWYNNGLSSFIDLNPYLLGNGRHTLKIILLPVNGRQKELILPTDMEGTKLKLVRFEKQYEPGLGRAKNYKEVQDFEFPKLDAPVPRLELEWEITIDDLPYEIEGWSNSQDLSLMDQDELEKEVADYYKNLRELLNNGNIAEYTYLEEQKDKETATFGYYSANHMKEANDEFMEIMKSEAVNNMWPIENYRMFLYANGRLVRLERIDGENKGWDVLIRETQDGTITSTGIFLHKPIGKDAFEIIRK